MAIGKILDTGSTGLDAGMKGIEVRGHNVVNTGSLGFFSSLMLQTDGSYETLQQSAANPSGPTGGSNVIGKQIGSGTQVGSILRDFTEGASINSNTRSHLAIENGKGWFQVLNVSNGYRFATKDGSFREDTNGYIVTKEGYRLQGTVNDPSFEPTYTATYVGGELVFTQNAAPGGTPTNTIGSMNISYEATVANGKLTRDASVPASITDEQLAAAAPRMQNYSINNKGELQIQLSNGDGVDRGQVLLMTFKDEQALIAESGGMMSGFAAAGMNPFDMDLSIPGSADMGAIAQRKLNGSNVDLTRELTGIISDKQLVNASSQIIRSGADALDTVVNILR